MKKTDRTQKFIRLRIFVTGFLFSMVFSAIAAKAVYLQIYRGPWLAKKAADQYEMSFKTAGKRGTIYDTYNSEMAVSIHVTSIGAYPKRLKDREAATKVLSKALNMDRRLIEKKLDKTKSFVWIKRKAIPREAEMVKNMNMEGICLIPEYNRFYPNKTLAAQAIGFTGIDGYGLEGIEYYYNEHLKGPESEVTIKKDALGNGFEMDQSPLSGQHGHSIRLTIDKTVQYITEKTLKETVQKFKARSGMAIVMAPDTGAVLAMAHHPFFNPNSFEGFESEHWRNRILADQFEPGSTMKIFNAAAAIESGACLPDTIFYCENGEYKIGENTIHDAKPYGWLSLTNVIKHSSNIGAVKITETTGPETLYNTLRDFGFGEKTGIDSPGEAKGALAHYNQWSPLDAAAISFGQGISVSALQLITAASVIANDGVMMKPYIVQGIIDHHGKVVKRFGPKKVRRVVSTETAKSVMKILRSVIIQGGTGVKANINGYSFCGKTGTAQKIDENGTYAKGKYIASFIGFTRTEKPEAAILVVIDEPMLAHYGGDVAAPAFRKIAHEILNYLHMPPKKEMENLLVSRSIRSKG
jgi:cell division protein FtsI (penicillin-binding protein 3)